MTTATLTRESAAPTPIPGPIRDRLPSLPRLTNLEIRKSLSTRSGRWVASGATLLPAGIVAVVAAFGETPGSVEELLGVMGMLVAVLMLTLGVLSTAGEWTHRTGQTTFLTVPRRGPGDRGQVRGCRAGGRCHHRLRGGQHLRRGGVDGRCGFCLGRCRRCDRRHHRRRNCVRRRRGRHRCRHRQRPSGAHRQLRHDHRCLATAGRRRTGGLREDRSAQRDDESHLGGAHRRLGRHPHRWVLVISTAGAIVTRRKALA